MRFRISTFLLFLAFIVTACQSTQPLDPQTTRQMALTTWQQDAHIIWEIEWPAIPIGGLLTVESWRSSQRYRYEILEATAPALVGETLIFDGTSAWQYNHFTVATPTPVTDPWLSPVSDVFALIERRLRDQPLQGHSDSVVLSQGPAKKITLAFDNGDHLTIWQDERTGLPARLELNEGAETLYLTAREFEPLDTPVIELFRPTR